MVKEQRKRKQDEVDAPPADEIATVDIAEDSSEDEADDDSDAEAEAALEALIGEEASDAESVDTDDFSDPETIGDGVSGIKLVPEASGEPEIHTKFSDGTPRIIKPEIDPVYDSDDSDAENFNTIGNIPISAYEEMPHIGYDINGKRIMRPAKGSALDQLLESIDLPAGWTGLLDQNTGESLKLNDDELELIRKIQAQESTDENINPYEPMIEWFTGGAPEVMPLMATPEPKRRFVPSKHEAKRVMKIVRAIREGKILTPDQVKARKEQEQQERLQFDLWNDETDTPNTHIMNLKAPKMAPPTHEESYNPPEEYLMTEEERKKWEETDPADRERNFIPQKYSALRKVPQYGESVRERFERCLDLYLAPRVRHNRLNIDPESLIPDLPSPKDLRPFPIKCSTVYQGHDGRIRTVSVDPSGTWLATGGDDGTVRVWEVLTGRQVWKAQLVDTEDLGDNRVESVEWNPDAATNGILAVAVAESVMLVVPPVWGFDIENAGKSKIEAGWGYDTFGQTKKGNLDVTGDNDLESDAPKKEVGKWQAPSKRQAQDGVAAIITTKHTIKKLSWHRRGDYFVTVAPSGANSSVLVHQVSKHVSQSPFRKSKGIIQDAKFHPFKPLLFVASQRTIRVYDLAQQVMSKKLMPGARLLSGIDIHPRGDHLVASSYDKRVLWHDLDLGATPYKTLRYHDKAVRGAKFHRGKLPLFATAADDGSLHVFHATVYDDLVTNPLLVPLKKLTGHKVVNSIGVMDLCWHPKEAWLFSAGADGTARLWTT
ncbi:hypothetical protein DIURU_000981 [Diutina rugosa]|uniref:Ribosome biogenesis protein ERB1 n=1 Tax=Diutina rugosa TaxID=5481 RepID=A0A642UW12_DIURU|nr:uncharacterized protein DIURU_000981 [Diutina rugosa]KAA8906572.1 hypothetical protein DIURU_000981 [Diutina rugosa]